MAHGVCSAAATATAAAAAARSSATRAVAPLDPRGGHDLPLCEVLLTFLRVVDCAFDPDEFLTVLYLARSLSIDVCQCLYTLRIDE